MLFDKYKKLRNRKIKFYSSTIQDKSIVSSKEISPNLKCMGKHYYVLSATDDSYGLEPSILDRQFKVKIYFRVEYDGVNAEPFEEAVKDWTVNASHIENTNCDYLVNMDKILNSINYELIELKTCKYANACERCDIFHIMHFINKEYTELDGYLVFAENGFSEKYLEYVEKVAKDHMNSLMESMNEHLKLK